MKVRDVMMRTAAHCSRNTNLAAAVETMWSRNCGILPIIDAERKVIGVVTDRDICIALGTRNKLPGEITVGEVMTGRLFTCTPDEDVRVALGTMGRAKVRRLPVVTVEGKLEGILSMDDLVVHSRARLGDRMIELSYDDVVETLKRVYRADLPEIVRERVAAA